MQRTDRYEKWRTERIWYRGWDTRRAETRQPAKFQRAYREFVDCVTPELLSHQALNKAKREAWVTRRWGKQNVSRACGQVTNLGMSLSTHQTLAALAREIAWFSHTSRLCSPYFNAVFLELVRYMYGKKEADILRGLYRKHKVRYKPYRDPASGNKAIRAFGVLRKAGCVARRTT